MEILYIYRNPKMGFSIGKVFKPIEKEMTRYASVSYLNLPCSNYRPIGLLRNIFKVIEHCKKNKYDIIHITGAEHYLLPFLCRKNVVVTIHDLGFYTNFRRNTFKSKWIFLSRVKTLKLATALTFISNKSYEETINTINIPFGKCHVIPNPVDDIFFEKYKRKEQGNSITILQVGTKPNKNLERTIVALNGLNCHLRIVGPLNTKVESLLKNNNINYSNTFNISDEELLNEYRRCDIVSFPSLYEGFGMPIIEGQACGKIVVTSNLSPMKEISGNGSILVNPNNIESIRSGFIKALELPDAIRLKGYNNAQKYNVERISKMYFNLYKSLV